MTRRVPEPRRVRTSRARDEALRSSEIISPVRLRQQSWEERKAELEGG